MNISLKELLQIMEDCGNEDIDRMIDTARNSKAASHDRRKAANELCHILYPKEITKIKEDAAKRG